jgi:hypothetical protein
MIVLCGAGDSTYKLYKGATLVVSMGIEPPRRIGFFWFL